MQGVSMSCYWTWGVPSRSVTSPTFYVMLCFFVTSYWKYHRHPHHIHSLERLLTYPFCFNSPLRVAWFRCPVATAKAMLTATGSYDHIWWSVGSWQCPVTSLDPKFWCYIIRRFGSLEGQSRLSLAAGIAARLLLKISLCVRSLSTSKTYKFAKRCTVSIITTAHYGS